MQDATEKREHEFSYVQNRLESDQRAWLREDQATKQVLEKLVNEKSDSKKHEDLLKHFESQISSMQTQMLDSIWV